MNLLFSLDANYIPPLKTLLKSIFVNHPNVTFDIYVMHATLKEDEINDLERYVEEHHHRIHPINAKNLFSAESKRLITRYYTLDMYSWLFAPYVLPESVDRILYLDPDVINLNNFSDFYYKDFKENYFVATNYKHRTVWAQPFNNLRLENFKSGEYYNAGVVLMNIKALREKGNPDDIVNSIRKYKSVLILPDQDIFNLLYDRHVLTEDWQIYNMDPRAYEKLQILIPFKYNLKWVENEVVFIHYCGKHKPWDEREKYKYSLGKYYFIFEDMKEKNLNRKFDKNEQFKTF